MKRRRVQRLTLVSLVVAALAVATPTRPAAAIDPTLDAAVSIIAQATAQAAQVQAAQRAAAAAQAAEATRQAQNVKATAAALSAEATRQAQSIQATAAAQSQNAQVARQAIEATATAQALNAKATATAQVMNAQATATSQAVAIAAQATDTARLSATYATRQDRFTWGLLVVELFFVCGSAWVLWKLTGTLAAWAVKMRPQTEPTFAGILASATAQPSAAGVVIDQAQEPEPRMPTYVTVNNDPRFVEALDRWAEKYDREHGVNNGD